MTAKRFMVDDCGTLIDMHTRDTFDYVSDVCDLLNEQHETIQRLKQNITELLSVNVEEELLKENEKLKSQLYCDDEEGICTICKHHYLVKDDEVELGYYNSRCKKGHYECARVSLKYCEDFEKEVE